MYGKDVRGEIGQHVGLRRKGPQTLSTSLAVPLAAARAPSSAVAGLWWRQVFGASGEAVVGAPRLHGDACFNGCDRGGDGGDGGGVMAPSLAKDCGRSDTLLSPPLPSSVAASSCSPSSLSVSGSAKHTGGKLAAIGASADGAGLRIPWLVLSRSMAPIGR